MALAFSLALAPLSGCRRDAPARASDIDFKTVDYQSISDIEATRYAEDAGLFTRINRLSVSSQKDALSARQRSVVILKYLEDVYKLASARVSKDLGQVYMFSKGYRNYIAVLQAYCEYYARDIQKISEHIQDEDFQQDQWELFIALGHLEDFWIAIQKQMG